MVFKQTKTTDWEAKYKRLRQSLDDERDGAKTTEKELRRALVRVSAAGIGINKDLDKKIDRLKRAVNKDEEHLMIQRCVHEVTEQVSKLDETRNVTEAHQLQKVNLVIDGLRLGVKELIFPELPRKLRKHLQAFSESDKYPQTTKEIEQVLAQFAETIREFIDSYQSLESKPEKKEGGNFWRGLFNFGGDGKRLLEYLNQLAKDLAKILRTVKVIDSSQEKQDEILERLQLSQEPEAFALLIEEYINLLIASLESERNLLTQFLASLNMRLAELNHLLALSQRQHDSQQVGFANFQSELDHCFAQIKGELNTEQALQNLKGNILGHIETLETQIGDYRGGEEERLRDALDTINQMNSRLNATEEQSKQLQEALSEQEEKAHTDELTGLPNRAAYEERLYQDYLAWMKTEGELCLIVCDIDFFKKINDTYGHQAGDKVLKIIGKLFRANVRKSDFIARIGGEEFVLLCTQTNAEDAKQFADKFRQAVANYKFIYEGERVKVTMSFGVSAFGKNDDPEQVFARADKALYRAKEGGRNQVIKA